MNCTGFVCPFSPEDNYFTPSMDPKAAKGKLLKKSSKPSPKEKMALGTSTRYGLCFSR